MSDIYEDENFKSLVGEAWAFRRQKTSTKNPSANGGRTWDQCLEREFLAGALWARAQILSQGRMIFGTVGELGELWAPLRPDRDRPEDWPLKALLIEERKNGRG